MKLLNRMHKGKIVKSHAFHVIDLMIQKIKFSCGSLILVVVKKKKGGGKERKEVKVRMR